MTFILAGGCVAALAGSLGCYAVGVGGIVAMVLAIATTMPLGMRLAAR